MTLDTFLQRLNEAPETIVFADTLAVIDAYYDFTPTQFRNGDQINAAGQNNGSCKIFSFARLHGLTPAQTLHCFGDYYRQDVLGHPEGTDHQNIRNFMVTGWGGVEFGGAALASRR
jgi:hypothetical protein